VAARNYERERAEVATEATAAAAAAAVAVSEQKMDAAFERCDDCVKVSER
jgi:hypothetical protein